VRKQYQRNHKFFDRDADSMPVYGTIASQFNDPGMNSLYRALMDTIVAKTGAEQLRSDWHSSDEMSEKIFIIPPARNRYLSEISENNRRYDEQVKEQAAAADKLYALWRSMETLSGLSLDVSEGETTAFDKLRAHNDAERADVLRVLMAEFDRIKRKLSPEVWDMLTGWKREELQYQGEHYVYEVRGKEIRVPNYTESLSHTRVPKVAMPRMQSWGDKVRWAMQENTPGFFPYTAGIYPFKREGEDPTRMFAGEGGPERTNRRFHYVSIGMPAKRLSTAFDSVTLYGRDPDTRPDIYGKIGNSGVSVCCLDDAKKLYSGFNLADPKTSVSMTINGPAPMLLGFFMNAAIDQQCELYIRENGLEKEVEPKKFKRFTLHSLTRNVQNIITRSAGRQRRTGIDAAWCHR
jgi:isobutyryl-CoA mutase